MVCQGYVDDYAERALVLELAYSACRAHGVDVAKCVRRDSLRGVGWDVLPLVGHEQTLCVCSCIELTSLAIGWASKVGHSGRVRQARLPCDASSRCNSPSAFVSPRTHCDLAQWDNCFVDIAWRGRDGFSHDRPHFAQQCGDASRKVSCGWVGVGEGSQ